MAAYTLLSKTEVIPKNDEAIYLFITDFRNFYSLLPEDKISNWKCTENSCSFTVAGMIPIELQITEQVPCQLVKYASLPGAKYPFHFTVLIEKINASSSKCSIKMEYELNPIINKMAEKPLGLIVDKMVEKIHFIKP